MTLNIILSCEIERQEMKLLVPHSITSKNYQKTINYKIDVHVITCKVCVLGQDVYK